MKLDEEASFDEHKSRVSDDADELGVELGDVLIVSK